MSSGHNEHGGRVLDAAGEVPASEDVPSQLG